MIKKASVQHLHRRLNWRSFAESTATLLTVPSLAKAAAAWAQMLDALKSGLWDPESIARVPASDRGAVGAYRTTTVLA
ncbi:hypothetical protein [Bradyrhizobium canariense]|uniref:hypothetical protein n=1 Tax=Bradyrhizobium canariense TaxID=255045 RepID=UPI00117743D3|nr:hypothetical protein [Bradyrhizobium canariense]